VGGRVFAESGVNFANIPSIYEVATEEGNLGEATEVS